MLTTIFYIQQWKWQMCYSIWNLNGQRQDESRTGESSSALIIGKQQIVKMKILFIRPQVIFYMHQLGRSFFFSSFPFSFSYSHSLGW